MYKTNGNDFMIKTHGNYDKKHKEVKIIKMLGCYDKNTRKS